MKKGLGALVISTSVALGACSSDKDDIPENTAELYHSVKQGVENIQEGCTILMDTDENSIVSSEGDGCDKIDFLSEEFKRDIEMALDKGFSKD